MKRQIRRDPVHVEGQPPRREKRSLLLPDGPKNFPDEACEEDDVVVPRCLDGNDPPLGRSLGERCSVCGRQDASQGGLEELLPVGCAGQQLDNLGTLLQFVRHGLASFRRTRS